MNLSRWIYFYTFIILLSSTTTHSKPIQTNTKSTLTSIENIVGFSLDECNQEDSFCSFDNLKLEIIVKGEAEKYKYTFRSDGTIHLFYSVPTKLSWPKENWPTMKWLKNNWKAIDWRIVEYNINGEIIRENRYEDNNFHSVKYDNNGTPYFMDIDGYYDVLPRANPSNYVVEKEPSPIFVEVGYDDSYVYIEEEKLASKSNSTTETTIDEAIAEIREETENEATPINSSDLATNESRHHRQEPYRYYHNHSNTETSGQEENYQNTEDESAIAEPSQIPEEEQFEEEELIDTISNIANNETATLVKKRYIFLNHSSYSFDDMGVSKEGVENLLRIGREYNTSIIATVPTLSNVVGTEGFMGERRSFFEDDEIDIEVTSAGGQHQIDFTNAEDIFLGGGHLSYCLCETIRDTVRGSHFIENNKPLNIYIVNDATYDLRAYEGIVGINFLSLDIDDATKMVKSFFLPNFKCPNQNSSTLPDLDLPTVKMDVYFQDQPIGSYALASEYKVEAELTDEEKEQKKLDSLKHLINIRFVDSNDVETYLKENF